MYKYKTEEMKVPTYIWAKEGSIGDGAIEQLKNVSSLPFAFHHTVMCPDGHQGYGMPVGGVLATKGVVIPNAVGVDIGCGMCAMKTSLTEITIEQLKKILGGSKDFHGGIRSHVPVGFSHHRKNQEWHGFDLAPDIFVIQKQLGSARKQLGTLGGGNHFIEFQKGSDGYVWVMLHSGSRNFGYQIAKVYNKIAQKLCIKWYSNIPEIKGEDGLAFLPLDSSEGKEYIESMNYALNFAYANRLAMIEQIKKEILNVVSCDFEFIINVHHNYAQMENHFGSNVMVHRKGAISAKLGQIGIIPGSQGTASYIVEGLGNEESFQSCSHGAGRKMSRTKAQKNLNLNEEQEKLDQLGILHAVRGEKDLDEAAGAYKDIDMVMEEQSDLVKILVKLNPLAVIKG